MSKKSNQHLAGAHVNIHIKYEVSKFLWFYDFYDSIMWAGEQINEK